MNIKRRIIPITAMIISLVMVLSGCGNPASNASNNNSGSTASASPASTAANAPKVTITMEVSGNKAANGQDFELDVLPKMIHEKFPNITMDVQKLPDNQYNTSIMTKLASGQAPDILRVWPNMADPASIDALAKAGYLADLSNYSFMNDISSSAKKDMSYNGKIYGITKGIDMLGVYYNKSLFQKAGISNVPTDWNTFLKDCQTLKDAGITPIVMGDKDPWWIQFGLYQIAANTVYPGDKNFDVKLQNGQVTFPNSNWVKAISMYKELYTKGYIIKNSLGLGGAQATQMFIDGKAAMTLDGTWDYPTLTAKGAVSFDRGFFPLPANQAGQPVWQAVATGAGWAVNANTQHMAAIKQILNYWFDPNSDLFKKWVSMNASISAFKGVPLNHSLYKNAYDQYLKTGNAIYFANQMWPSGVADTLESKFAEIIGGLKTTPQDVATAMQSKFNELWKAQNGK